MIDYKVEFEKLDWQSPMPGVKHKFIEQDNLRLRLVEYSKEMPRHWCEKGHYGIVLSGEIEVEYTNQKVIYKKGDGIFIPDGTEHKHKAKVISDKVLIFFVEHIA